MSFKALGASRLVLVASVYAGLIAIAELTFGNLAFLTVILLYAFLCALCSLLLRKV